MESIDSANSFDEQVLKSLSRISENAFLATPREPPKPKLVPKGKTFKVRNRWSIALEFESNDHPMDFELHMQIYIHRIESTKQM